MICVEGLEKHYGRQRVLASLDLSCVQGRAYGVLGPNGSGKTTLFRILTGLLAADAGRATVMGVHPRAVERAQVGYMPQDEALYGDLSVRENIDFFASICGVPALQRRERVDEVLALTRLAEFDRRLVEHLSGGMARRASLACAIVHRPRLLFLDEPTVGVDPRLRIEFWDHFARLKEGGTTILVSTHHLDEASRCDELVLMRNGSLLAKDTPARLLESTGADSIEQAFLALSEQSS
jgi:ABC-2 type transport system ATP-binding protein